MSRLFNEAFFPSLLETEERRSKLFKIIIRSWIIFFFLGFIFNFVSYYYANAANEYMQRGYLVSALTEFSSALIYAIISTASWLVISLIIGIPFLFGKNMNKHMKLCGLFFIISSLFEAATIYIFFQIRSMMLKLAMEMPMLSDAEVISMIDEINATSYMSYMLQQGDIATVGLGYFFWGQGVKKDAENILTRVRGLLTTKEAEEGFSIIFSSPIMQAIRTIRSGGNMLSWAGALYLITALYPIQFLSFLAFILLIFGFSRISRGWNTLTKIISERVKPSEGTAEIGYFAEAEGNQNSSN